jgi:vesicle coat complex subunit
MESLLTLAASPNAYIRQEVATFLDQLKDRAVAGQVVRCLLKLSQDSNDEVRWRAARSLGNLSGLIPEDATEGVLDRLLDLTRDEHDTVQMNAVMTLANFAGGIPTAGRQTLVNRLLDLTGAREWWVRVEPRQSSETLGS